MTTFSFRFLHYLFYGLQLSERLKYSCCLFEGKGEGWLVVFRPDTFTLKLAVVQMKHLGNIAGSSFPDSS